ncbi:MAG TPA: hypothetical protein VMV86_01285 [Methanosarcinales archaeon]|nr:hypothetical protein [Methanosarcinales archaeon]
MITVVLAMVLLLSLSSISFAQEPPEPTKVALTCDVTQDFQISWYGFEWNNVVPEDWTDSEGVVHPPYEFITGTPNAIHNHIGGIGIRVFEAAGPQPDQKVVFGIPINSVPYKNLDARWWGIARVRWRCRTQVDVDGTMQDGPAFDWSPTSWWVLIIDTKALGRPR